MTSADLNPTDQNDKESLIEFPAALSVKAMGLNDESFDALVTSTVMSQLPTGTEHKVTTQQSSGGKYVSVSVHFTASSLEELKRVYAALREDSRVLYLLQGQPLKTRALGLVEYETVWSDMRSFTDERDAATEDELWICEHPSVYTLGQAGRVEHIHNSQNIPVVKSDRGGQVTYHGPGQLIVYTLVNLRRKHLGVRDMVMLLEQAVIDVLQKHSISATARRDAPGVYVDEAKIAALGLRVRKGCTYHGLSFNVDVDLAPYAGIDPCGYQGLEVTSTKKLGVLAGKDVLSAELLAALHTQLDVTVETRTS